MAGARRGTASTGGGVTPFKQGNLARYWLRSGSAETVIVLSWEASEDWVEVFFSSSNTRQWVRTETLTVISES